MFARKKIKSTNQHILQDKILTNEKNNTGSGESTYSLKHRIPENRYLQVPIIMFLLANLAFLICNHVFFKTQTAIPLANSSLKMNQ